MILFIASKCILNQHCKKMKVLQLLRNRLTYRNNSRIAALPKKTKNNPPSYHPCKSHRQSHILRGWSTWAGPPGCCCQLCSGRWDPGQQGSGRRQCRWTGQRAGRGEARYWSIIQQELKI